jgi:hypothetical protein
LILSSHRSASARALAKRVWASFHVCLFCKLISGFYHLDWWCFGV